MRDEQLDQLVEEIAQFSVGLLQGLDARPMAERPANWGAMHRLATTALAACRLYQADKAKDETARIAHETMRRIFNK